MLDPGGEAGVDVEHRRQGLGILALDQRAAQPARGAAHQRAGVQARQLQGQPQPVGAALGEALGLVEQSLLVHAHEAHPVHGRGGLRRLQGRQRLRRSLLATQGLQQEGQRLVPLLDRLRQVLDRSGILAELGDGAVQAGLAVRDQPLVIGPHLERRLVARGQVQHVGEDGRRAQAQPDRQQGGDARRRRLPGGAQHEAADLPAGADIEVPLGKQQRQRLAQPCQAIHVIGAPAQIRGRYEAKSKQWASQLAWRAHSLCL